MTTSHIPTRTCSNPDCGGGWVLRDDFEVNLAEPCPNCNQLARAAYEDGRLPHLLAHRNDPPDEEEVRRRNIEKAKEKWQF